MNVAKSETPKLSLLLDTEIERNWQFISESLKTQQNGIKSCIYFFYYRFSVSMTEYI